jgi:hypothetical protein
MHDNCVVASLSGYIQGWTRLSAAWHVQVLLGLRVETFLQPSRNCLVSPPLTWWQKQTRALGYGSEVYVCGLIKSSDVGHAQIHTLPMEPDSVFFPD